MKQVTLTLDIDEAGAIIAALLNRRYRMRESIEATDGTVTYWRSEERLCTQLIHKIETA